MRWRPTELQHSSTSSTPSIFIGWIARLRAISATDPFFDPGKPILRFRPERNAAHRSENAPTLPIRTRVTLEKCNSPRIMDGYGKEFVYRLLQVTAAGWYAAVDTKVGRTRNSIRRRAPRWHATFTDIYFWKCVRILYRFRLRENRI